MAIIFGSGEPVSRLRRALDVKGKVNLGVDEIIVPTILLQDASRPPFRRTGVRWYTDLNVPAVAGQFGRVRIFNQSTIDQLIDHFIFHASAAGQTGIQSYLVGSGGASAAGGAAVRTTEIVAINTGNVPSRRVPIETLVDSITPTSLSLFYLGTTLESGREFGSAEIKTELVLPASREGPVTNLSTITIEGNRVNEAYRVTISGLYWDSLPLTALT